MKNTRFLLLLLGCYLGGLEFSSASLESRQAWNFGAHIGTHRTGDLFNFEITTPGRWAYENANIPQSAHWTFHLGFHNSYNTVGKTDPANEVTQSFHVIAFFESQTRSPDFPIQVWSRLGPGIHLLPSRAYDQTRLMGLHLGLGADFPFQRDRNDNLFGTSTPCFTVGVHGAFGLPKAINLAGEPDLLTGFNISVGLRNHF